MDSNILDRRLEELTSLKYRCSCGRVHSVATERIVIEEGALSRVGELAEGLKLGGKAHLIADKNTYEAAGRLLEENLLKEGFAVNRTVFDGGTLHADEKALGRLIIDMDRDTGFIAAAGSGTINDISRFISLKMGIPYIIAATAPSMDGYASTVSPLLVEGFKTTFTAVHPSAIIGDLNVLVNAPGHMIAAGLGDMLGKVTALSDWILAREIEGEHYCPEIASIMARALRKCVENAEGLIQKDKQAVRGLTEGLILSGIAMQMMGNSRPASGSEHHISHYWEMQHFMRGKDTPLHGAKVGAAISLAASMYEKVLSLDIAKLCMRAKDRETITLWESQVKRCFGTLADEVIEKNSKRFLTQKELGDRMERLSKRWEAIRGELESILGLARDIKGIINSAGGPPDPKDMGIGTGDVLDALRLAKEVRDRYTILQLADELGILDRLAWEITGGL